MKPSPRLDFIIDPWETTRLIGSTCKPRKGLSGGVLIDQSNHQKFWKFYCLKDDDKQAMFMNTINKHVGMIKIILVFLSLVLFLGLLLTFTPLSKIL